MLRVFLTRQIGWSLFTQNARYYLSHTGTLSLLEAHTLCPVHHELDTNGENGNGMELLQLVTLRVFITSHLSFSL